MGHPTLAAVMGRCCLRSGKVVSLASRSGAITMSLGMACLATRWRDQSLTACLLSPRGFPSSHSTLRVAKPQGPQRLELQEGASLCFGGLPHTDLVHQIRIPCPCPDEQGFLQRSNQCILLPWACRGIEAHRAVVFPTSPDSWG